METMIIEFGLELTEIQYKLLEGLFTEMGIAFYEEPQREPPFKTLEELQTQCERK